MPRAQRRSAYSIISRSRVVATGSGLRPGVWGLVPYPSYFFSNNVPFVPPNPKEFDSA